ncbi:MAG: hypothetical protein Q7S08_03050 [bacterium]|nr:hypothetical protein [bacterium]
MSISIGSHNGQKMLVVLNAKGQKAFLPSGLSDAEIVLAQSSFVYFNGTRIQTDRQVLHATIAKYKDGMLEMSNGQDRGVRIRISALKIGQTATIVSPEQIAAMVPVPEADA